MGTSQLAGRLTFPLELIEWTSTPSMPGPPGKLFREENEMLQAQLFTNGSRLGTQER